MESKVDISTSNGEQNIPASEQTDERLRESGMKEVESCRDRDTALHVYEQP